MAALIARARAPFDGLFDWWLQELREARAAVVERYGSLRSPRFQLVSQGDPAALDESWVADQPRNSRIELVLAEAEVLIFKVQLPPMAEHELRDAIELQLERKLPLPRDQLYVDWEVTQKHPDRARTVAVAAVRRARVDQWRERLRAWPWRLARVSCKDPDGTIRFNLLSRSVQRVSFAFGRREALLAWFAAGLVVGLALLTAGQWIYERMSLAKRIDEARAQVSQVRQLRAQLERESKPIISIRELAQAPAAGSALAALSTVLPTDTWIYQAEIRAIATTAPVITLEGYAPSAATLVQTFEQAQQFSGIQLVETSAADAGLNRFKLKAQLQSSARP